MNRILTDEGLISKVIDVIFHSAYFLLNNLLHYGTQIGLLEVTQFICNKDCPLLRVGKLYTALITSCIESQHIVGKLHTHYSFKGSSTIGGKVLRIESAASTID